MKKLGKICTPPKHLLPSELIFLKKECEESGGRLSIIHKFFVFIEHNQKKFFIKINLADNEFYLFSKEQSMIFFHSFGELKEWIVKNIFRKDEIK